MGFFHCHCLGRLTSPSDNALYRRSAGLVIVRLKRHLRGMATTYRIVPQSIISYGVEITEISKPPRVLLTCSTEAMAEIWIAEIKRLRATKANGMMSFDGGQTHGTAVRRSL